MILPNDDVQVIEELIGLLRGLGSRHELTLIQLLGATDVAMKQIVDGVIKMAQEEDKENGNGRV